jgi:hypothetical protein
MSQSLTPKQGKAIVGGYDWSYLLISLFPLNRDSKEAEAQLRVWLERESADWCGDADEDGKERVPSYIMLGTRGDRIQGPAFYILIAGATDDVQLSVKGWNKTRVQMCTCIRFQGFKKSDWRRQGLLRFLNGFFDLNCLISYHLEEQDLLSDNEEPS